MLKVLYVEDDIVDVLHMERLSKKLDFNLTVLRTYEELKSVKLHGYDLILCDAHINQYNRPELEVILKNHPNYRFISGTQKTDELEKPVDAKMLSSLFKNIQNAEYNLDYIRSMSEDDADYFQEMLQLGIQLLPKRIQTLKENLEHPKELAAAAHKTKSTFRILGISDELLIQLEGAEQMELQDRTDVAKQIESLVEKALNGLTQWESKS